MAGNKKPTATSAAATATPEGTTATPGTPEVSEGAEDDTGGVVASAVKVKVVRKGVVRLVEEGKVADLEVLGWKRSAR